MMNIGHIFRARSFHSVVIAIEKKPWWFHVLLFVFAVILFMQASAAVSLRTLIPALGMSDGATNISYISGIDDVQSWFVRWDAGYYLTIVRNGYHIDGAERAFYPLYPLLVVGLSRFSGIQILWSGLIVSTLSYAAACLLLYRWVLLDYASDTALWAVYWLCIFPMSFFLIAFYAESLLLLTSIAAFYFVRRGNFIVSGIFIALAGATRSFAFLLAVPFIVEFFYQRKFDRLSWLKFITGASIAPLGTLAYFMYLAVQSGNYDLLAIQQDSTKTWSDFFFAWPWTTWIDGIRAALFGTQIKPDWFSRSLVVQDLGYAFLGLVISIWSIFHLRPNLSAYLIVSMLFFSINHGPFGYAFWSMPRHVAALAPVYLALALLTLKIPARFRWIPVTLSLAMLGLLSIWFVRGGWVS